MLKSFTLLLICVFLHFAGFGQQSERILEKYIAAQKSGTDIAFTQFIRETYHPDLYSKIDLKKHLAFYRQIHQEFGPLNPVVYKVTEEKPLRLVVQLIREDQSTAQLYIDPANILVVKIDLSEKDPRFMDRGLGLGALVCTDRRK